MLDQQDADAVPLDHPLEDAGELLGLGDVEAGRRLVEQQEAEAAGQGAGQLDQTPLPGGEVADRPAGQMLDAAVVAWPRRPLPGRR